MVTSSDVLLYIPNLIGYTRVLCTLLFLYLCQEKGMWHIALSAYVISFAADLFDGMAARAFNQTSKFGAVLDMVTDRCSTALLLSVLGIIYPQYFQVYLLLMALDISSHWMQMKAAGQMHHKSSSQNFVVSFYYNNYFFFGYCCVGAEFFYILMYALRFCPTEYQRYVHIAAFWFMLPGCAIKQFVNICQLATASSAIAQGDAEAANKSGKNK
jgi:CDP-diacylglycerol--inositol 3-phosphatidyltransferase